MISLDLRLWKCAGVGARNPDAVTAEMGQIDRHRRRRKRAATTPKHFLHRRLDTACFIEGSFSETMSVSPCAG